MCHHGRPKATVIRLSKRALQMADYPTQYIDQRNGNRLVKMMI